MRRSLTSACLVLTLGMPALAFVAPPEGTPPVDPRLRPLRVASLDAESVGADAVGAREFVARHGGTWEFSRDRRTGRMTLVQGSGIPLVPGRGNALDATAVAGLPLEDGAITVETLAPLVERFLGENAILLGPSRGRLELDRATSLTLDGGRLHSLNYAWTIDGVPVEGAYAFVRLNAGNITQFGAPFVGDARVDTAPAFGEREAMRRLLEWSGDLEVARPRDETRLVIQVEDDGRGGLAHRLVWIASYKIPGRVETWEGRIDARTGEIVAFRDANAYGRVTGGVYPRTVVDAEIRAPFPFTSVTAGSSAVTSASGAYAYPGGVASSSMAGRWFDANCQDGCSNPGQPFAATDLGTGRLDFGLGGSDHIGNGFSTRADRNAFFHLNQVRRIGKKWLPALGWLDTTIAANVNIASTCNAFYDGTVNFYRSGGGCNNTGEIADVMQHEWGHGLDGNTRGGDGATGEGTADVVAMLMTHDSAVGPYFRTGGAPVRQLDKTKSSRGLMTRSNIGTKCGPGGGPLGYEVHCEGEIYGQAQWDLAQALVAKHGTHTGWRTTERIFFTSLTNAGSYLPTQAFPIYDAYIQADDDDGNLTNGTPNGGEIYGAFNLHEIAGTARVSSAGCARPAQPILTVTPTCASFDLSWTSVSGAVRYEVLRNEILEDSPFFPVATVTSGTSWVDTDVAPGVDYGYAVMAVTASACESSINARTPARLPDQPILSATAAAVSDVPRGNRSGFADPGEEVDLAITLANFGDAPSGNPSATLIATTPGVTVLNATDFWPTLAPGSSAANSGVLRFTTDDAQVACGDTLRFRLDPTDGSGCVPEDSWLDVVLGTREILRADTFEAGQAGWAWDSPSSTATAGHWTWGDPDATAWQPGDDVSDPGVNCWFTAPNAGGEGTDDVDGGVTTLVSPLIDLSGLDEARLSYWRWFANRDLGEDAGDYFRADVSSNGGVSWVNLETLGTNDSAPTWTRREFDLTAFITLTSQVRLRFQASDGPATGNLIEAALDEVRIERSVCDDTPACYVAPSFAGLASAAPGPSCAEVDLSWSVASSNCQNATLRYNVYRSTDSSFVPSAENRIATALAGTSFRDVFLQPGQTYHYLVRAEDSRSGEDANLVRRSVTAASSPDLAAPTFGGIGASGSGEACGETTISWPSALETCSVPVVYDVYRSADPGFVPSQATLVASTHALTYTDAALPPGTSVTYVVRARDAAGNSDANLIRATVGATILDRELVRESFENGPAGWATIAPNDATTGRWELGDPQATGVQPGDDYTEVPGVNAWTTGLAAGGGDGDFDVDGGTTTLLSSRYDLSSAVDPVVRYARWFTNDRGANPGDDPFDVDASNDDGGTWTRLEQISGGTPLAWVVPEIPLAGKLVPSSAMRFRFTARDTGVGGSLVEAAVDEFTIVDRDQGCSGCPLPVLTVGTILVSRQGDDIVLDWSADPVEASRYVVYRLDGTGLDIPLRVGTTATRSFVHEQAAANGERLFYRVSAVDSCGNESER